MADREFLLRIVGDVSSAQKSLGQLEGDVNGLKQTAGNIGKTIVGAIAVDQIVRGGQAVVKAASDQEQAMGALTSVFKDYSDEMDAFGNTTAENLGISKAEFSQLAAVTGSMLKNAGVPLDEMASSTQSLTERAADMAAMFGGTVPEAMEAINSALKGERDPIEKYGVSIKEAAVQAKALEMGLVDSEGKVTDYGKAMATQALIMEQSADSAGTFARESGTLAGQQATLTAQFKDLQAEIGQQLLPVVVKLVSVLIPLITFIKNNADWLLPLAAAITGIVLAMKAWTLATEVWSAATKIGTGIQWLFNAAMAANPIGLVVIAITALVAGFVLLYTKVDWFRDLIDSLWQLIQRAFDWIKSNWPLLLAILTGPFGLAVLAIQRNWDSITQGVRNAIESVRYAVGAITDVITWPFRKAYDLIRGIWDDIDDGAWQLWGRINNALSGIYDVITYPFRRAVDAIKWLWNSTIGGFGFSVPSWVPLVGGRDFRIPKMAAGGIVTRPTIALIGEAGPEAVIPLSGGGGVSTSLGSVTINVYALTASAEVGRRVYEALQEYNRTTGRVA